MSRAEPQHSHAPLMALSSAATLHESPFPTLSYAPGLTSKLEQGMLTCDTDRSDVCQMCVFVCFTASKSECRTPPTPTTHVIASLMNEYLTLQKVVCVCTEMLAHKFCTRWPTDDFHVISNFSVLFLDT